MIGASIFYPGKREGKTVKYLRQIVILLAFSFVGEGLSLLIPLPIPGSIYGIVLLFLALETKLVKLSSVKDVSEFLISFMPVMFIPAGVGLMSSWGALKPMLLPAVIAVTVVTVVVMAAAGRGAQSIMRLEERRLKK